MRDRENHVVVSNPPDEFRVPFRLPFFLERCLAARTGTVITGNRVDDRAPAFLTDADVVTQFAGLTIHNAIGSLALLF